MTLIALHSDLHMERQKKPQGWLSTIPDVLILAGDILRIDNVSELLFELSDTYPKLHIIFVPGNHEYYGIQNMLQSEKQLRKTLDGHTRIHFLQCDAVEVDGVRFIGCTGWSQMLALGQEKQKQAKKIVEQSINDFYQIGMGGATFTPGDCIQLGNQHYDWLEKELSAATTARSTVVITHFAPSLKVANPLFPLSEITAYFCASFDALMMKHQPAIWAFGHTHANFDIELDATRVVSNQHGYGRECQNSYDANMIIEL